MKIRDIKYIITAIADKNEPRYYLRGALVTAKSLSASNGHIVASVEFDAPLTIEGSIIIPGDSLRMFIKKFELQHGKKIDRADVNLTQYGDDLALASTGVVELFTPMDAKYPDFSRALREIEEQGLQDKVADPTILPQFDYGYLKLCSDAIMAHRVCKVQSRRYLNDNFSYFKVENLTYIIMPMRL